MQKLLISIFLFLNIFCLQAELPFKKGEKLEYSVWYNFVKGGKSYMKITEIDTLDGTPLFHSVSITKSIGLVDKLFGINDRLETWFHQDSLYSYRFSKKIREGSYKKDYTVNFNYRDSMAIPTNKDTTIKINQKIHDGLSIFYYLRGQNLKVGQILKVNNFDGNKFKPYKIKVSKIQKVKVPAGKFRCYKLEPYKEEGELFEKHQNRVKTYISTDSLRLPVKITSKANFGTLILKLENVKYLN